MFRNYKAIFEKKVLVEKTIDFNNRLYVFAVRDSTLKTESKQIRHQLKQEIRGREIATEFNLRPITIDSSFINYLSETDLFSHGLTCLLRDVEMGIIKHIYVHEKEYLFKKNKYILAFIINYFENKNVTLYNKSGVLTTNYEDYTGLNGVLNMLKDYNLFHDLIKNNCSTTV